MYEMARNDASADRFSITCSGYTIECTPHGLPLGYQTLKEHAVLVPETKLLFLGAGERILAYRLDPPTRLWDDRADTGFLGWEQHGDTILLAAELEFAAWTTAGEKLW